jgi:hypothetical protein
MEVDEKTWACNAINFSMELDRKPTLFSFDKSNTV